MTSQRGCFTRVCRFPFPKTGLRKGELTKRRARLLPGAEARGFRRTSLDEEFPHPTLIYFDEGKVWLLSIGNDGSSFDRDLEEYLDDLDVDDGEAPDD